MNPTDLINALNDGRTVVDSIHGTILYQIKDRVFIQTPCLLTETPKISAWAVRGLSAEMFDKKNNHIMTVRAKYFGVKE